MLARKYNPAARIVAFEPLSGPAKVYREIFDGDDLCELHAAAIGPQSTKQNLHISARDDSSSLLGITHLQEQVFPGTKAVGVVEISVGTLDAFLSQNQIESSALLKLDVQGFEYEALLGCESLLSEFEWIYCECSFIELYEKQKLAGAVIAWLAEREFYVQGVYNTSYDANGNPVQADFLFCRS